MSNDRNQKPVVHRRSENIVFQLRETSGETLIENKWISIDRAKKTMQVISSKLHI